jgi:hypothetical protein
MDRATFGDLLNLRASKKANPAPFAGVRSSRIALTRTRSLALALITAILLIDGLFAPSPRIALGSEAGTLSVTPQYANSGKTITVVVDDATPGTTILYENESTDFTGNPYSLPVGFAAQQHIYRVKHGPIADSNGDGTVNSADILTSLPNVSLDWINTQNGTFAVTQYVNTSSATPFTVTYRSEVVDTTTVEVRSSSDIDGFVLTLAETGYSTNIYSATFLTGTATVTTNATSPSASTRPAIKVADAGVVTVEYADTSPPTLLSEAIIIDTTAPVLVVDQLPNGATTSNAQNWVSVDVTDDRSGIKLADIKFNVDVDRDGVFGETGEVVSASTQFSSTINHGWAAFAQLPTMSDGTVKWYVSVTDVAGNAARTDSGTATGNQDHSFEIDTSPPQIVDVLLGDDYELAKERTITNQPNRIRVNFSEPVDPESVVPGRFLFGSLPAISAVVYEDLPSAVFLTYENLPSISEPMQVLAGAVQDLLDLNSERFIVPVTDRLGPTLEVLFSTVITRDKVTVTTRSREDLATPPTIEINGVTFGSMTPTGMVREWAIDVTADLLTGSAAGDGVKNVEIAGFDKLGNRAHGGVRREDPAWPENAHLFELDRVIKLPVILPAANDTVTVANPVITVSYAAEAFEYPGDTHASVTVISAKLDGFEVTSLMKATTASSWTFQPGALKSGAHEFVIQARDDAGNIHATPVLRFIVDPPPTPTPTPEPTATPVATEIAIEVPGTTPPSDLINTPTPVPTIEPTAAPTPEPTASASPEPTALPTPDPSATETPVSSETPSAEPTATPEVDVEATVQAIRAGDGSDDPDGNVPVVNNSAGYTIYGCGLPLANAGVAGGDYSIMGLGLVGLVVMARRRRSGRNSDNHDDE